MKQKRTRTTVRQIVEANLDLIASLPNLDESSDPARTCWACGWELQGEGNLNRSHVVAKAHGGADEPSNYFLLCHVCHDEQPDGLPRESQLSWLRGRADWLGYYTDLSLAWTREFLRVRDDVTEGDITEYLHDRGLGGTGPLLREGLSRAAGWRNGRANALHILKEDFRGWLAGRRPR
jgi:hypothetical protein